jgi:protein-disulfide isomerase
MIERFWGLGRISPCAPLIDKLLKSGIDSGVGGTPTFFVNGVRYDELMGFKDIFIIFKTLRRSNRSPLRYG